MDNWFDKRIGKIRKREHPGRCQSYDMRFVDNLPKITALRQLQGDFTETIREVHQFLFRSEFVEPLKENKPKGCSHLKKREIKDHLNSKRKPVYYGIISLCDAHSFLKTHKKFMKITFFRSYQNYKVKRRALHGLGQKNPKAMEFS